MTPTTIPAERDLSYIFTTFTDVARHTSRMRCHSVSKLRCNVQEITINHKINRYYVLREGQRVDYPLIAHLIVHRA